LLTLISALKLATPLTYLNIFFFYFSDSSITFVDHRIVKPDNFHLPSEIKIYTSFVGHIQNYEYSYRKFSSGDYKLLYNTLSTCD
jgi:hypothetical protein